jgi:hypothetical protein
VAEAAGGGAMNASLPIAVRAFTTTGKERRRVDRDVPPKWPDTALIFDTETSTDDTQRLLFGFYRFCRWEDGGARLACLEEGIFYADDLSQRDPDGFACLSQFASSHLRDTEGVRPRSLRLMSRSDFVNRDFYKAAY